MLRSPFAHVLLIDDARLFGSDPAYPSVEAVEKFLRGRRDLVRFRVADDIIHAALAPQ